MQDNIKEHDPDYLAGEIKRIATSLGEWPYFNDGVFFSQPNTKLKKTYLRDKYLIDKSKNKRVLHFGFADSPFTKERTQNNELLHLKIAHVASELWGSDIDSKSIKEYTSLTNDDKCLTLDICAPIKNIGEYSKNFDIIIFGEILEHLLNPGDAIKNLYKLCKINNAELILTTPNAFNAVGFIAAMMGNEIVHPEHYYYYSPVTLRRLLHDCGFENIDISFYSGENTKDSPGLTFPGLIAECSTNGRN